MNSRKWQDIWNHRKEKVLAGDEAMDTTNTVPIDDLSLARRIKLDGYDAGA